MKGAIVTLLTLGATLALAQPDVPGTLWNPAYSGNYQVANRPTSHSLNRIVLHITEGSYAGAISWFKNSSANVSAHFVIRSSDGQATQMVRIKDIAWHATSWNSTGIGFEHEGIATDPAWWTDAIYRSSTDISRYLAKQYNIPRNRTAFVMHREVPGTTKTCPGYHFDIDYYLKLVMLHAQYASGEVVTQALPGRVIGGVVRYRNEGDLEWKQTGTEAVRLATYPEGRISPFKGKGWLNGSTGPLVSVPTTAGQIGEFHLNMMSPMAPGVYTEGFQLLRADGTRFGPPITYTITVGDPGAIYDNTHANFSVSGTWSTGTTAAGRYGTDYRFRNTAPGDTGVASWFLNAPMSGWHDVFVWYPQGTNRSAAAPFVVEHAGGSTTVFVNQQTNGGTWVPLGRFKLNAGTGFVRLKADAASGFVVIADAVKVVRTQR